MMTIKNNLDYVLKKMNFIHITCFLLFLPIACSSGDAAPNTAVTNLAVEVTLVGADDQNPNGDGSGVVKVTATANNATRYAFRFDNGDLQDSSSGTMEHVFSEVGTNTYNIVAWAYSDTGDFVNETVNITVDDNISNSFLSIPEKQDDTDLTFYYFGWENNDSSWLIQQQERATGFSLNATIVNNSSYVDLDTAWVDKAMLGYL